jgi:hypothetical protein
VVQNTKLVNFSILLLADEYSFVKELAVLACIKGIVLHCHILGVVIVIDSGLLIDYLRWLKLIMIMTTLFIL